MALKEYVWKGSTWQFTEGKEPVGAVSVDDQPEAVDDQPETPRKRRTPANKARSRVANKGV